MSIEMILVKRLFEWAKKCRIYALQKFITNSFVKVVSPSSTRLCFCRSEAPFKKLIKNVCRALM